MISSYYDMYAYGAIFTSISWVWKLGRHPLNKLHMNQSLWALRRRAILRSLTKVDSLDLFSC